MNRVEVDSSNIESIGYAKVLEVKFKNGGLYQYLHVPETVVPLLMDASSKGRALNEQVKGVYNYQKVEIVSEGSASPPQPKGSG